MKPAPFDYHIAADAAEALGLLAGAADGEAMIKACGGSQSLGPMLNLRLTQVDRLVDVSRIATLRGHALGGGVLRLGAAVTHAQIEDGAVPDVTRGLLPHVAAGIAYRAVRNRGTIGGSLAHADPAADWVSTVCLLAGVLVLQGAGGERRVPAHDFFLGPFTTVLDADELLVAVELRAASAGARWAYRKLCRKPGEFAEAIAGVWLDPAQGAARAVLGALGGPPHVVDGAAAVAALRRPEGLAAALDDAGVEEADERDVHATLMTRALRDVDAAEMPA